MATGAAAGDGVVKFIRVRGLMTMLNLNHVVSITQRETVVEFRLADGTVFTEKYETEPDAFFRLTTIASVIP